MIKYSRNLFILSLICLVASCSKYQAVLNSKDANLKYETAKQYYDKEDYSRARILLEDALKYYKGKRRSREILLMLINSCFKEEEHLLVVDYAGDFERSFSGDIKAQDVIYRKAKSLYIMSPRSSLDQTITIDALDAFQVFVNRFPESEKLPEVNEMVQELMVKIQKKEKDIVKLFYKMEKNKACIKAAENFLIDHSVSQFIEEVSFMKLSCLYNLAINSVVSKKKIRLEQTKEYYQYFIKKYPDSKHKSFLEEIKQSIKFYSKNYY